MTIVGVQLDMAWEDKQANFAKVRALLDDTDIAPNSLIVLPEMFATGFSMNASAIQEPIGGVTERFLQDLARQRRAYVIGGVVRQGDGPKPRNEAVACDDRGREMARYCKLHPFSLGGEAAHYERGREIVTFPWGGFTVAPFICYDLRFPEIFRGAVGRGADLLVVMACWPIARQHHWTTLLKARAIENQAFVVGVNRCGTDPSLTYRGGSMIVDPHGRVVAESDDREGAFQAHVDPALVAEYRRALPFLEDRRTDYDVLK